MNNKKFIFIKKPARVDTLGLFITNRIDFDHEI